jgi:hypothetical protein
MSDAQVKNDDIDGLLRQIQLTHKNLTILVLNLPEMDLGSLTAHEQLLVQRHSANEVMLTSLKKTGTIPVEFQMFAYSKPELIELLTPPEQYLFENRLILQDRFGQSVNILNEKRVTTGQPDSPDQMVFLVGGCRVYGFGSEDRATIGSHLQQHLNSRTPFRISVQNCGQMYGGGGKKYLLLPHIRLLLSSEIRDNDILVIGGSFTPTRPKCYFVDSRRYFAKPYKYGEVFFEERLPHLNANGNRLVADCIFDFLSEKKLLGVAQRIERPQLVEHPI